MGHFFHRWRRKVGVATLLMALVLMGGWVRSLANEDEFRFSIGHIDQYVFSENGRIQYSIDIYNNKVLLDNRYRSAFEWRSNLVHTLPSTYGWTTNIIPCSFQFATGGFEPEIRLSAMPVPYWSFVIPLALISVMLLLSKPDHPDQKEW